MGKRKQQQHKFFSPEPKMQWHARRERRVRKWQEAQHSANTLISASDISDTIAKDDEYYNDTTPAPI